MTREDPLATYMVEKVIDDPLPRGRPNPTSSDITDPTKRLKDFKIESVLEIIETTINSGDHDIDKMIDKIKEN